MRVKILRTAAGPDGVFAAGQILDLPKSALAGLEVEVLDGPPAAAPPATGSTDGATEEPAQSSDEAAAHEPEPTGKRGGRRR